jgi:hypothetical protein
MECDGVTDVKIDAATNSATVTVKKGTDPSVVAKALHGQYSGEVQQ